MAVSDALDVEAAVDEVIRAALRAVARTADDDRLAPEAGDVVTAVLVNLVAEAAQPVPVRLRIPLLSNAQTLIREFVGACANESV